MNQQLWACSNSMSLDIWECFKWNTISWFINTEQMPANKDICRNVDFYSYTEARSKDLVVRSGFLGCVTVFTYS